VSWLVHVGPGGGISGSDLRYDTAIDAVHSLVARLVPDRGRLPGAVLPPEMSIWHAEATGRRSICARAWHGYFVMHRDGSGGPGLPRGEAVVLRARLAEAGMRELSVAASPPRVGVA